MSQTQCLSPSQAYNVLMTLHGSYYSCTHFADSEVEALTGFNSCQVAALTAEPELSALPMSICGVQDLSQGSSKQSSRVGDDGPLRSSSGVETEHSLLSAAPTSLQNTRQDTQ